MQLSLDGSVAINLGSDYNVVDQIWALKLIATSDASTVVGKNTVEYPFVMTTYDGCLLDALTGTSTIENFVYYIDDTGLRPVPTPTYSQSVANCNVEWSLVALDGTNQETPLSTKQAQYAIL